MSSRRCFERIVSSEHSREDGKADHGLWWTAIEMMKSRTM